MLIKSEYFFNIDDKLFFLSYIRFQKILELLLLFPFRHLWPVCFVHSLPIGEQWDQTNNESKNVRFPFPRVHSRAVLNESLIHRVDEVSSDLVTRNGSAYCGIRFLTQTHVWFFYFFLLPMSVISLWRFVLSESKMTVNKLCRCISASGVYSVPFLFKYSSFFLTLLINWSSSAYNFTLL